MRKIKRGKILSSSGRMDWKNLFFREKGYSSGWLTRQHKRKSIRKRGQATFLDIFPELGLSLFLQKSSLSPFSSFFFAVLGFALLFEKPCPLRLWGHSSSAHPDRFIGMSWKKNNGTIAKGTLFLPNN